MSSKNALDLLAHYGGDSSDDEVPGSRVSTKRMHKDDNDEPQPSKRHERLPLPNFAKEMSNEVHMEDSTLHDGRVRSFPHERGNWATYIYIPYERNDGLVKLLKVIMKHDSMKAIDHFHISLTKTVILKYHWIDPFVATLKDSLCNFTRFMLMFNTLNIYCNEERTRTFIGLEINTGTNSLMRVIQCLDRCLEEFRLSTFYKDPSFHMSIAWCVGDRETELKSILPQFNQVLYDIIADSPQDYWYIYVDKLLLKTGNKSFQFHLS